MLTLARPHVVHLSTSRGESPRVLPSNTKQYNLGHVSKIKSDTTTIRAAILPELVPYKVCLVFEPPSLHYPQPLGKQGVRHPQVQMSGSRRDLANRQLGDFVGGHGPITREAMVFRCHLSGPVYEAPRRIGENGCELAASGELPQIFYRFQHTHRHA